MFFLSHIWLIRFTARRRCDSHVLFWRKLEKTTVNAVCVGTIVWLFSWLAAQWWQYTMVVRAEHLHQPYQTILYTCRQRHGHLTYATQSGRRVPGRRWIPARSAFQLSGCFRYRRRDADPHLFTGYMAHEGGYYRFFGYLNLFHVPCCADPGQHYVLMFVVGRCGPVLVLLLIGSIPPQVSERRGQ